MLLYTQDILDRYNSLPTAQVAVGSPSTEVIPLGGTAKPTSFKAVPKQIVYSPSGRLKPAASNSSRKVFSARTSDVVEDQADLSHLELAYALQVRKVLYITEFMVLINYVEVIVPIIFCKYRVRCFLDSKRRTKRRVLFEAANLVVMYYLPNRVYYSQIVDMDDTQLRDTLGNVMLYCFLQLVSLVVLFFVLWHKLHISALRQLAFVLEKQGEQVQTKLILWVFYNVQATLQHFGAFCLPFFHIHSEIVS
jgi:hypothetical protein